MIPKPFLFAVDGGHLKDVTQKDLISENAIQKMEILVMDTWN